MAGSSGSVGSFVPAPGRSIPYSSHSSGPNAAAATLLAQSLGGPPVNSLPATGTLLPVQAQSQQFGPAATTLPPVQVATSSRHQVATSSQSLPPVTSYVGIGTAPAETSTTSYVGTVPATAAQFPASFELSGSSGQWPTVQTTTYAAHPTPASYVVQQQAPPTTTPFGVSTSGLGITPSSPVGLAAGTSRALQPQMPSLAFTAASLPDPPRPPAPSPPPPLSPAEAAAACTAAALAGRMQPLASPVAEMPVPHIMSAAPPLSDFGVSGAPLSPSGLSGPSSIPVGTEAIVLGERVTMPAPPTSMVVGLATPAEIERQKEEHMRDLDEQQRHRKEVLTEQTERQREYIRAQAQQQKAIAAGRWDQHLRAQEIAAEQEYQQQLSKLQEAARQLNTVLENQAAQLIVEYHGRKTQDEFNHRMYDTEMRNYNEQMYLTREQIQNAEDRLRNQLLFAARNNTPAQRKNDGLPEVPLDRWVPAVDTGPLADAFAALAGAAGQQLGTTGGYVPSWTGVHGVGGCGPHTAAASPAPAFQVEPVTSLDHYAGQMTAMGSPYPLAQPSAGGHAVAHSSAQY